MATSTKLMTFGGNGLLCLADSRRRGQGSQCQGGLRTGVLVRGKKNKSGMKKIDMDCVEPEITTDMLEQKLWEREETRWEREEARWVRQERLWEEERNRLLEDNYHLKQTYAELFKNYTKMQDAMLRLLQENTSFASGGDSTPSDGRNAITKMRESQDLSQIRTEDFRTESSEKSDLKSWGESVLNAVMSTSSDVADGSLLDTSSQIEHEMLSMDRTGTAAPTTNSLLEEVGSMAAQDDEDAAFWLKRDEDHLPRPVLKKGDDEIYWVSRLHRALLSQGYDSGNEDIEDFYFGEGTENALRTYQVCNRVKETGITDKATWDCLIGSLATPVQDIGSAHSSSEDQGDSNSSGASSILDESVERNGTKSDNRDKVSQGQVDQCKIEVLSKPFLSPGDGGEAVRVMQQAITKAGFFCGEDDMDWWFFGDSTEAALKTFQACHGLAESGNVYDEVWDKLLPYIDLDQLCEEPRIDKLATNGVFLLGEGRYENPTKRSGE